MPLPQHFSGQLSQFFSLLINYQADALASRGNPEQLNFILALQLSFLR
jgi:hypothetical protein